MSDDLNILLFKPMLDESSKSVGDINNQIKEIQQKLNPILLKFEGLDPKIFSELTANIKNIGKQLNDSMGSNVWIEKFGGNLTSAITKLETESKKGVISLDELEKKLLELRNVYGQVGAFDGSTGIKNDKALTDAVIRAEKQRTQILNQEQQTRLGLEKKSQAEMDQIHSQAISEYQTYLKQEEALDKAFYLAITEDAKRADKEKRLIDKEYSQWWGQNLKEQEALDRAHFMAQQEDAKRNQLAQKEQSSRGSVQSAISGVDGGFSTGKMLVGLGLFNSVMSGYETMVQGMKDVENGSAGLEQVLSSQIHSQGDLNKVTNDFIGVAQKYGESVKEVLDGAKLWGRQYKSVGEVMTLTNASTLLSVVDNLSLADSNRGLEATMNSLGMAADSQASAFSNSMKIVDSWSKLAHEASVSANDLVHATQNSAGAAHQAGVSFDQLQALITSGVRNTGLEGANVGNMLKSLFASIRTDKAETALKGLDISLKQVGKNGKEEFKPVFDVLLELSQKLQTTDKNQQKLIETISGGKFQWSKTASLLSDYNTIIDAYAVSLNSAGAAQEYAQVQMNTLSRDIQRLKDTFIELAAQTDQNGLGKFLKDIVNGLTDLIVGLEKMPSGAGRTIEVIGLLLFTLKALSVTMVTLEPLAKGLVSVFPKLATSMGAATVATEAETIATRGLAGAFTTLDIVSGGLALVLGAVVGIIIDYSMKQGEATRATEEHNQALQDKVAITQKDYNLSKQKQSFMDTAIQQEQKLKAALEDTTLSAVNRNKIMGDMVNLYHAVGKATGDEALQQVDASNIKNYSLQTQREAMSKLVEAKRIAYENAVTINNQEIENDIKATNQKINNLNSIIQALENETQAKIAELSTWDQITISAAVTQMSEANPQGAQDLQDQYLKEVRDKRLADAKSQKTSLKAKLAEDEYTLASNKLDLANIDVSGSSPSGVPDSNSKASGTQPTPFDETAKYQIDQYSQKLRGLDDQLKQSEAVMTRYKDTSKEYGDELNKQVSIHKQKQDLVHEEADSIRAVDDALQHRLDTEKLDVKQRNALLQQLEQNKVKVSELSNTWWDYEKTIEGVNKKQQEINNTLENEVIDKLKQAYEAQKNYQEEQLKTNYDNQVEGINKQITALDKQKTTIDETVKALQEQWKAQDDVNKISQLQDQLGKVEADKRFDFVGLDGILTRTYDVAKATELEKQIADEQTRISRDAQIKQYEDQKTNLDNQIVSLNLQLQAAKDNYDKQKENLDNYWNYRMQQDQLKSEADRMILNTGYAKALVDAQAFATKMNAIMASIKSPSVVAGGAVSTGLGQSTAGSVMGSYGHEYGMSDEDYQKFKQNSEDWFNSPKDKQKTLNDANNALREKYGVPQEIIPKFKLGGVVPDVGTGGTDSVYAKLTPKEIVVPSFEDLMKTINLTKMTETHSQTAGKTVNFNAPINVQADNIEEFMESIREFRD